MASSDDCDSNRPFKLTLSIPLQHPRPISAADALQFFEDNNNNNDNNSNTDNNSNNNNNNNNNNNKKTLFIDVRTDDYQGGNIFGAKNIPYTTTEQLEENLLKLLKEIDNNNNNNNNNIKRIVFYCMYGKERGPSVAAYFLSLYLAHHQSSSDNNNNNNNTNNNNTIEVCSLRGGFSEFLNSLITISDDNNSIILSSKQSELFIENFDGNGWAIIKIPGNEKPIVVYKKDIESSIALLK